MVEMASLSLIASRVSNRLIEAPSLRALAVELILDLRSSHFQQGNFTTVVLQDESGRIISVGVSKRTATDCEDPNIGINIAAIRAVEAAIKRFVADVEARASIRQTNGSPKQDMRA